MITKGYPYIVRCVIRLQVYAFFINIACTQIIEEFDISNLVKDFKAVSLTFEI